MEGEIVEGAGFDDGGGGGVMVIRRYAQWWVSRDGIIGKWTGFQRHGVEIPAAMVHLYRHGMDNYPFFPVDYVLPLLAEFPDLARVDLFESNSTLLQLAAAAGNEEVCQAILFINPMCVNARRSQFQRRPLALAAGALSPETCRILLCNGALRDDPAIMETMLSSARDFTDAWRDTLWLLIDSGCTVLESVRGKSESVRLVLMARKHARDAALAVVGLRKAQSTVAAGNGRDAVGLVARAVWDARKEWVDVEEERCKRHRQERPASPYGREVM